MKSVVAVAFEEVAEVSTSGPCEVKPRRGSIGA